MNIEEALIDQSICERDIATEDVDKDVEVIQQNQNFETSQMIRSKSRGNTAQFNRAQ